jgi:hypothetical protein
MENVTLALDPGQAAGRLKLRIGSVLVALSLVFAAFVLVQQKAEAAPAVAASAAVAAAVASPPAGAAAQIDILALIRSIVCPILNALASGPFAGFIGPIIRALQVAFGCTVVSGG